MSDRNWSAKKTALFIPVLRKLAAISGGLFLLFSQSLFVFAEVAPLLPTRDERISYNRNVAIDTNLIDQWPQGPVINAGSAVLMDAETGTILYAKNMHSEEYPASTTKILTTLLAWENSSLDEIVTFSYEAVFGTPRDSNHIAMDVGDTLTMEECLNAILIRSANEVSSAVAEHIAGSIEEFAEMMNARAKELGCLNSHFVNANGLPNDDHYTSAYDLATIGRAFFANETLCKISTTPMLSVEKKSGTYLDANQTKLLPGKEYAYPYLVGCKTGFTDIARFTIVSCAEKNGMKLICAIMRDENPDYYQDTITLFDYGFSNFEKVNISGAETKYNINNAGTFYSSIDIFGSSKPILSLNKDDYVILPKTAAFSDTESSISYETGNDLTLARITYTFHGHYVGFANVDLAKNAGATYSFDTAVPAAPISSQTSDESGFLFINVFKILLYIIAGIAAIALIVSLIFFTSLNRMGSGKNRLSWKMDRFRRRNDRQRRRTMLRQSRRGRKRRRNRRDDLHF